MTGTPALPPEGWYPDPENVDRERYWGGQRWSDEYRTPQEGHRIEDRSDPPRSLGLLSKLLIAGLVLSALVEVNNIAADLDYMGLLNDLLDGNTPSGLEIAETEDRVDAATIAVIAVQIAVGLLLFIPWFHRAYSNLARLGVQDLRYKPGWAIGSWLIPIFNLFRPKQIANDIWRASPGDAVVGSRVWHERPVAAIVHWWWGMFILSGFVVGAASNVIATANDKPFNTQAQITEALELERSGYTVDVVGSVISIVAAVLAIIVVRKITEIQTETIERVESEAAMTGTLAPVEGESP